MKKLPTILLIPILCAVSNLAQADFFQYTDDSGTVVMVDDASKIPKKYRKKTRITRTEADDAGMNAGESAGDDGRGLKKQSKKTGAIQEGGRDTDKPAGSSRVRVNNDGKQYAQTPADCDYANFSKLDAELRKIGFMAGAGGGYVKSDNGIICNPCVVRINSSTPLSGNVTNVYEPANSLIYRYADGASYEYCTMKNR